MHPRPNNGNRPLTLDGEDEERELTDIGRSSSRTEPDASCQQNIALPTFEDIVLMDGFIEATDKEVYILEVIKE